MIEHEAWYNHGYQVYEGIARIPFLLRGPGVARGRSRAPVSGIDLAPTLLGFAGVAPPERWDGYDLRREPPPADRIVFTEALWHAVDWRAAIRGEEKWVVGVKPETRAREAHGHFDLSRDPSETRRGPWVEDGEVPAALEAWIAADPDAGGLAKSRRDGKQRTTPKVSPRADDAARERLRALGYVE